MIGEPVAPPPPGGRVAVGRPSHGGPPPLPPNSSNQIQLVIHVEVAYELRRRVSRRCVRPVSARVSDTLHGSHTLSGKARECRATKVWVHEVFLEPSLLKGVQYPKKAARKALRILSPGGTVRLCALQRRAERWPFLGAGSSARFQNACRPGPEACFTGIQESRRRAVSTRD